MVEKFLQSGAEDPEASLPHQFITSVIQDAYFKASSGEEAKLSETLSKLQEELMQAGYHSKFACFWTSFPLTTLPGNFGFSSFSKMHLHM